MTRYDRLLFGAGILLAALLIASAFFDVPQINNWLFRISVLIILATSWNLMANAGLVSLGHSAFWGVGSYAAVLVANTWGVSIVPAIVIAMVVGALLGGLVAFITGSLRGIFFAIMTLAVSEGLRIVAMMVPDFTGGAVGLFLREDLRPGVQTVYLLAACAAISSVCVAALISRLRLQFASRAMRDDEDAAQMLGINPRRQRVIVVAISGSMASVAGALSGWYGGYLDPDVAFTLHNTILAQIAPILGGIHTLSGPVIGAITLIIFSEATRIFFGGIEGVSQLTFGILLVVCILFLPRGIHGLLFRNKGAKSGIPRSADSSKLLSGGAKP